MAQSRTLAVCTAIYPGVEPFLPAWYRSLEAQTDRNFDLWIALDDVSAASVEQIVGTSIKARWISVDHGATPAEVRQRVLANATNTCDVVVLVDSDDLLHPSRVASARNALQDSDLNACALRLVDQGGAPLSHVIELPPGLQPSQILPRNNVFGLSNISCRSELLRRCLPIPAKVTLVDWYLATRAWLLGARLSFDPVVRMDYRQHAANMARVLGPFTPERIQYDSELVRRHFQIMRAGPPDRSIPERLAELTRVGEEVEMFARQISRDAGLLAQYTAAFNGLSLPPLWWASVAHPALQHLWKPIAHINESSAFR